MGRLAMINRLARLPGFFRLYAGQLAPAQDLRDILVALTNRIAVLDGLRATGILLVIGLHCCFGLAKLLPPEKRQQFMASLPSFLDVFWQARGSEIIFILCGLLVSLGLFREMDRTHRLDIMRFYRKRLMRIVPMYWFALFLYVLADPDELEYLPSNLFFLANLVPGQHDILPVGWSLATQVHFYVLLPFLVLLLFGSRWRLLWLVIGLIMASAIRYAEVKVHPQLALTPFHHLFDDREYARLYSDALYCKLHTRLVPFLMGVATAWLWHYRPRVVIRLLAHPLINLAVLLLGVSCLVMAVSIGIHNPADAFYHPFVVSSNVMYLVFNSFQFCLGVCLLVVSALFPAGLSRLVSVFLSARVWHPFSELVYGLYLFHVPAIMVSAVVVFGTTDKRQVASLGADTTTVLAIFLLAVLLSLLLAAAAYVFIEKPFVRMEKMQFRR